MLTLDFTIYGNPDRNQGDWSENISLSAETIEELRAAVLQFQGNNDIGGGNWGEATLRRDGQIIGYMSYNGRVWKTPHGGSEEVIL